MFYIVPVPVRFHPAYHHVTEGVNSYAVITLEALVIPTRSFYVYVHTRDGSAVGEHHAIHSYGPTYFSVIAHSYVHVYYNFICLVSAVNE